MPKVKLTDRGLKQLTAKDGKQTDYFDLSLPNFAIRVSPSGRKSFCVFYRIGRKFTRHTLGSYPTLALAEAREAAQTALYKVNVKGEDPARQKAADRDAITLGDLAKEFLEKHSKPNKSSWREDKRIIDKHLIPTFGNTRAQDVTRPMIREMLEEIAETGPIMANRVLSLVSKIFTWSIQKDILAFNPCAHLEAPGGPETSRDRVLSDEEIRIVWTAFDKESLRAASMLKLRLLTVQRGGEVAKMRWADLDLEGGMWTIPADFTKNKKALHRVPLAPEAVRILEHLKAAADEEAKKHEREVSLWVFPGRPERQKRLQIEGNSEAALGQTELQKTIQRVRANTIPEGAGPDAGVSFRGHDLRRTAASRMTEMGVPRLIVKKILNHADDEITAIYDRFSYDKEKREALTLWAKRLAIITSGLREVAQA